MDTRVYNTPIISPSSAHDLTDTEILLHIYYLLTSFMFLFYASIILFVAFKILVWVLPKYYALKGLNR